MIDTRQTDLKRLDASNRAVRTLVQAFMLDIAITITLVVYTALADVDDWSAVEWRILGFLVVKSILQTLVSYLQRMQTSFLPPPTPQPEPSVTVSTSGTSGNYAAMPGFSAGRGLSPQQFGDAFYVSSPVTRTSAPAPEIPRMEPHDTLETLEELASRHPEETAEEKETYVLPEDYDDTHSV